MAEAAESMPPAIAEAMVSKVIIIGAGGVGSVVAHKCAQVPEVFNDIMLASRTEARCRSVAESVKRRSGRTLQTRGLDADDTEATAQLIREFSPDVVINVALPYQDLSIMDACLQTRTPYLDTANYEPPDQAKFEYKWQWAFHERFREAKLMALLGSGFDPGVTNVFCAYARDKLFDEIHYVDILDCNGGDHGHAFATNFNPEINLREITQPGRYWAAGNWIEVPAMSVKRDFDFPEVGVRTAYLLYHEELESLSKNLVGLKRIRFWMTFGQEYLTHLRVLQNVGMTRIDPVEFQGQPIVPIQFLQRLLPDPASLAQGYTGKTSIGCLIEGVQAGQPKRVFIYNVCDHVESYEEVGSQAISYTTGVPAVVGATMLLTGKWQGHGVFNLEQLDPEPFLKELAVRGLPWHVQAC
jgi:saccharopine dehydrogenase (NAD+, L-lysine-forming)